MYKCTLCPRNCGIDRDEKVGYCKVTNQIMLARAALHLWEEPCISGETGSGTVFFSGCNLLCVYCQNHDIAAGKVGKVVTIDRLVDIFFELKKKGANNINLVTGSHYTLQIIDAIRQAKEKGFDLPFVYNTSSYEKAEQIEALKGYIDIYLPDLKYIDSTISKKYSNAEDYFSVASKAIDTMVKQVGEAVIHDETGMMQKGVIVRHLTLPGCMEDSKAVLRYLYETYGDTIYISIMNQYTPMKDITINYPELNRKITEDEYDELVNFAIELGIDNGFIQEGETASESFIPSFDLEGV